MTPERRVVEAAPFNASTPLAALTEDVTPTRLHYVRNHFPVPRVADASAWRVRVSGRVREPLSLSLADLARLPARTLTVTLECAGNGRTRMTPVPPGTPWDDGAVSTATYRGVALRDVLARAGVAPDAVEVLFRGADHGEAGGKDIAFERSLPLPDAMHPDTLLAWEMNGAPLPPDHGFPLRAIVPGWYGVASVKWLTDLEVIDRPFEGYYQKARYTYDGWQPEGAPPEPVTRLLVKSLIACPARGERLREGAPTRIEGRAWAGSAPVARVEVSTDGGATWEEARLLPEVSPQAWRAFEFDWTPRARGRHVLLSRATDARGDAQPLAPRWNKHGYGMNAVVPVEAQVD